MEAIYHFLSSLDYLLNFFYETTYYEQTVYINDTPRLLCLGTGFFALLCPEGEMQQGLMFQVVVLLLASEAWNFLWWLPSLFLMFREAKHKKEERRYGKIAKLTSPILLVVPPLIYLAVAGLNMLPQPGSFAEACGFSDMATLFKASYASVALLFVAALFFPLFPFSLTNFWEYFNWSQPLGSDHGTIEVPHADLPSSELPRSSLANLPEHHSAAYAHNLATLKALLQEGESIVYATAPQVDLMWQRSGKGTVGTVVCTATLAAGLGGLIGLMQVTEGSMRIYCGLLAFMGLLASFCFFRAFRSDKKRRETCDYFLTTKRFCRLNAIDKPKNIFWEKDKPKVSLSHVPGTDAGNIHISPTSDLVSRLFSKLGGDTYTQKSEKQGELDGMEYVAHCVPIYALVQQLNTPHSAEDTQI